MLIEEQIAERQRRARKEAFKIEPQGRGMFGDYQVFSPASKRSYRVALRGVGLSDNYCACPDYGINTLGTCKHIEAVLMHARSRFGGKLEKSRYQRRHSTIYLDYREQPRVRIVSPANISAELFALRKEFFENSIEERVWETIRLKKELFKDLFDGAGSEVSFEQLGRRSMIESLKAIVPESAAPVSEPVSQKTDSKASGPDERNASAPAQAHGSDDTGRALGTLLEAGIKFLETLSRAGRGDSMENLSHTAPSAGDYPRSNGNASERMVRRVEEASSPLIKQEFATDKSALHIPLPESLTSQRIAQALTNALSRLMAG